MVDATPDSKFVLTEISHRDPNAKFWEIGHIRHHDGVLAVITERAHDGRISFAIFREFEMNGKTERSAFLAHRHIPAATQLMRELGRLLEGIEDRARARRRIAG